MPALALHANADNIIAMADEPITLEFLARQQQRMLDEMGSMRGEMGSMRDDCRC